MKRVGLISYTEARNSALQGKFVSLTSTDGSMEARSLVTGISTQTAVTGLLMASLFAYVVVSGKFDLASGYSVEEQRLCNLAIYSRSTSGTALLRTKSKYGVVSFAIVCVSHLEAFSI